ncbi:formyltetrahydrofolate deformylase [Sinimarinibacterium sp. CAU 1509]|uniref:formyltetrahydrofolate deformylase n=1 Tax=Sinimarinibacterium sp. CAU 1509 TaxID=2562283 RepID=UPI0010AD1F7B|nr:formyltetrahydrofolate deformylase [Sinimarinibacterium sp. CAU 1509]TJY65210.1 formyltetrahydrofolate deformylase [Sinimarinibacterium sp. CAU 1509]
MTVEVDTTARLLIACPDRPGIVAAVTRFLFDHGANITELDQHSTDPEGGRFFMRLEFQTPHLDVPRDVLPAAFDQTVAQGFGMNWHVSYAVERPRMAILVSRHDHALMELLWRWQRGELAVDIPLVISNHADLRDAVERFGVRFEHVPIDAATHADAEQRMLALLESSADFLVLARYMRILSPAFVERFPSRIINIHHSFLPAFAGADPYRQAYDRGVKLIGATAHYVTADLDQGPIIEQDTARVSHRREVPDLRELGRDLERQVLARAVRWHVEDRIIVNGNKTIVFT